jgi:hypothetical protein
MLRIALAGMMVWMLTEMRVEAKPFDAEVLCKKSLWAADFNFVSLEDAKKKISGLLLQKMLAEPMAIKKLVPLEIRKNLGNAVPYFEEWSGMIFLDPWELRDLTKHWDANTFYFVTPGGLAVKGKLPIPLSDEKAGTFLNLIELTDPETKKTVALTCEHQLEFPTKPGDDFSRREQKQVTSGVMEPYQSKYHQIEVEILRPQDVKSVIQHHLGDQLFSLAERVKTGETKKEAGQFAFDTCKRINPSIHELDRGLKELEQRLH